MEIVRISVEGVGRFEGKAAVEGFGPGVNILSAANEAGKSTLFRALRMCFFERHTSKNVAIKSIASDGVSLPVTITVDFTLEGCSYRIEKSFLRGQRASLSLDGRVIAKNSEADEKLWELLGVEPASSRSVDAAAFDMLWVGQRASFELPPITKGGETMLGAAIESEIGAVLGGERAKTLLAQTRDELAQYVTSKTGKALVSGPLGQAERKLESLRTDRDRLAERLRSLENQFTLVERLRKERARLADPEDAARHEAELAEARHALAAAKKASERLAALEMEERARQHQKDAAAETLTQLQDRARRVADLRERIGKIITEKASLESEESGTRMQLAEIKSRKDKFETEDDASTRRDRLLQRLSAAISKTQTKAELERKAGLLLKIVERRTQKLAELKTFKITAEHIRSLDKIERESSLIEAQLTASASKLFIAINGQSGTSILIDGRKAQDGEILPIAKPIRVSVGGFATLTLSPPDGFGKDHEESRKAMLARQVRIFDDTGITSHEEARQHFARRQTLETDLKTIEAELSALGVDPQIAERTLTEWREQIAMVGAELKEVLAQANCEGEPDMAIIEEERRAIAQQQEVRRAERKALEISAQEFQQHHEQFVSQRSKLAGELDEMRRTLAADLVLSPDATRAAELAEAQTRMEAALKAHQQAAGALADMRSKAPDPHETERLSNKILRLESAADRRRNEILEHDKTISNVEGQIQSAGGDGIGERMAIIESEFAQAEIDAARHRKRASVLSLLADTIEAVLAESREKYYRPVLRHLTPFVNDLFPGARLELGEGFTVSGISRSGDAPEPFERLSDGTQEQIAVLTRLAMGALLAERGKAFPIILDDALVFSDDDRIARLFDALVRAGANQQIIVLTCRTRAFAALGGRTLAISHEFRPVPVYT